MTAIAAAIRSAWTRFAERSATTEAMASLGPNLRKEAGLPPEMASRVPAWLRW